MNNTPNNVKEGIVCSRVFKGATTVKMIDGVACCPSCSQPLRNHKPTNKKKRR